MIRPVLCGLLVFAACRSSDPEPARETGRGQVETRAVKDIAQTAQDLLAKPPEPIAANDKRAAIAPTALVGTWRIKHLLYIKDGKPGKPEQPLMDGSWSFEAGGVFHKRGGNELEGTFVLTKDKLVISALGPALEYSVDKLTATELVVTSMIMPGMGTTTVLERAGSDRRGK